MAKKEYRLLGIICVILKVISAIALLAGIISFIVILIGGGGKTQVPKAASIIWLLIGIFQGILFFLISEMVKVLTKIEQNTRPVKQNPEQAAKS